MNVLLIDVDSRIPNLALVKVDLYHRNRGDTVLWDMPSGYDDLIAKGWADKIYVSCIFTENAYKCAQWEGIAEIGGSGFDLTVKLPPAIEAIKPRINRGFTSRGCTRNCEFCLSPVAQ